MSTAAARKVKVAVRIDVPEPMDGDRGRQLEWAKAVQRRVLLVLRDARFVDGVESEIEVEP